MVTTSFPLWVATAQRNEERDLPAGEGVRNGGATSELFARRARAAHESARGVGPYQTARRACGFAAVRAVGQEDLPDSRRSRNAALQPRHHPAAQGSRRGAP